MLCVCLGVRPNCRNSMDRFLSKPCLSFSNRCSRVARADKGKPIERWGRKASGLRTQIHDSGVASDETSGTSANDQGALSDVGLRLYHGFFVPGDYVSSLLSAHAPRVAQFLGLDAVGHGSVLSGLISGVVWLGAIVLIVAAGKLVRDLDRTLTAAIGRVYQELRRIEGVVDEAAAHCLSIPLAQAAGATGENASLRAG